MRDIQQLPPDQRAVLSLVLTQGKGYAEVASLLGMSEQAVRERAHAALDALAQHAPTALAVPSPRASTQATGPEQRNGAGEHSAPPSTSLPSGSPGSASPPSDSAPSGSPPARHGSRTGGAILLAALVVAIALAGIAISSSGGKGSGQATSGQSSQRAPGTHTTPTGSAGGSGAGEVHLDTRFKLTSTDPESRASGEGLVVSQGNTRAFYVTAQGLPPASGFFYAVWLYKSQTQSLPLGSLPAARSGGRMEGGGPLSASNLASFHTMVITRETSDRPSAPGHIVLTGRFALS